MSELPPSDPGTEILGEQALLENNLRTVAARVPEYDGGAARGRP